MELTFEAYTRKIKLYYVMIILMVLLLAAAIAAFDMRLPEIYVQTLVCSSLVIFGIRAVIPPKMIKMYIPDGEIKISAESITINSITVPVDQIKTIGIKIYEYYGSARWMADGSGNKIQVTDNNRQVLSTSFIIKTSDEMRELRAIVDSWKESNIPVETIAF